MSFSKDGYEWGYRSEHTAYVVDQDAGVSLETETFTTDIRAGRPHRVTLTLTNLRDEPVALRPTDGGCLLEVNVVAEDGSTPARPVCARSGDEGLALPGNGKVDVDAEIVAPKPGDWHVIGMCRCVPSRFEDRTPDKSAPPSGDVVALPGAEEKNPDQAPMDARRSRGLFTPPIRVTAA